MVAPFVPPLHLGPPSSPIPAGLALIVATIALGTLCVGGTLALDALLTKFEQQV